MGLRYSLPFGVTFSRLMLFRMRVKINKSLLLVGFLIKFFINLFTLSFDVLTNSP